MPILPGFTPSSSLPRIPFAQVPRPFISDPRINLREFRVYSAILTYPPNEEGERWPSRETIGRMTGLPPKVVSRTTSRLQDLGWLAKYGDGGRSHTARYIIFDQAQPPAVIRSFHLAAARPPASAQDTPPQNESFVFVNPPQIDPGFPPKGGQNGEGQEVDYLDAVDRESEPAAATADQTPPIGAHSASASHSKQEPKPKAPAPAKQPPPATAPEDWLEQAALMRPDLTAEQIKLSAEIFLDTARSKGNLLADWQPAFRNWIRRERAVKPHQTASTATQPINRYAHLDAKEQPVSAAVKAALAISEQNRIAMLIQSGIDPTTGLPIAPAPAAARTPVEPPMSTPIQPGQTFNASVETRPMTEAEECARFEEKRRIALAALEARIASRATMAGGR